MNPTILDFGAGYTASHTLRLRAAGYRVIAHDFGRNFVKGLHDPEALGQSPGGGSNVYDLVFASNVLNVQRTIHSLRGTVAQIANATKIAGQAIANFPESPRKLLAERPADVVERTLNEFFLEVSTIGGTKSAPVWLLAGPLFVAAREFLEDFQFYPTEIEAANVRPTGAVGRNPVVVQMVARMLKVQLA